MGFDKYKRLHVKTVMLIKNSSRIKSRYEYDMTETGMMTFD